MSEVAELVHEYADSVTNADAAAWAATWAPDAVWDMGSVRLVGRSDILAAWQQAMAAYDRVIQLVYNGTAELDSSAGVGRGRWYVSESLKPREGPPKVLLAYYDDDYIRTDGRWLFAARRLERLYSGPPDLSGAFTDPPSSSADP